MLKIAIVDDSKEIIEEVGALAKKHMETANMEFLIKSFTRPLALISAIIDGERFDIYVLDIEMPGNSGIDVAKVIRKFQSAAVIIFLTSHLKYAPKGYAVNALRYVIKTKMAAELPEALGVAVQRLSDADAACLLVTRYNNVTRIPLKDIIYARKEHRNLKIATTEQGILTDNRGIKEVFATINDPRFTFTERSCFINLHYAQAIDGNWMVMKNGERLPISRPMLPKVKEAIMSLWGG